MTYSCYVLISCPYTKESKKPKKKETKITMDEFKLKLAKCDSRPESKKKKKTES
jgi:hypothetical protein